MRRFFVSTLVILAFAVAISAFYVYKVGQLRGDFGKSDFRIVEFHSEGETDGYCYVTARLGRALLYARSVKGEQWDCNFLVVGYPAKRLIRQGYANEELDAHIDMSHEPLAPNGKRPPDFDLHFFIYGGRELDYRPVSLGPHAPIGVPDCSDVPPARKWNTPCRDEDGILVDPFEHPPSSSAPDSH
jgi:hypothetical protein